MSGLRPSPFFVTTTPTRLPHLRSSSLSHFPKYHARRPRQGAASLRSFHEEDGRQKQRTRRVHRGGDTMMVHLLRWWFKTCDHLPDDGFSNVLNRIQRRLPRWLGGGNVTIEKSEIIELDKEAFEAVEELLDDETKELLEDVGLSYKEFPMTLRMGLSVNSDNFASKFVVLVADLLCDLIVWDIFCKVRSVEDLARVFTGACLAYIFGDLLSGLYHWLRHNFESFGFDPERDDDPCEIQECEERKEEAKKDFYKTVATHCLASVPFLAVLWISPHSDLTMQSFGVYLITIVSILPALRQWASSSTPPKFVSILQKAGLMLRKSEKAISEMEYCIVSGIWNQLLSSTRFFIRLEHLIVYLTQGKIMPKSWSTREVEVRDVKSCGRCENQLEGGSSSTVLDD